MLNMLQADPEAEKRSIMSQRVPRCNGNLDGKQCKHYWFVECAIQVVNADNFTRGERLRRCLRVLPTQNIDYKDLATVCNQYEPSDVPYDPQQEVYEPLGDEEVAALAVMYAKHRQDIPVDVREKDAPFNAGAALVAYKALAAASPDDPLVKAVREKAAVTTTDLEARKLEGAEARKRNQAEMAENERLRAEAADAKEKAALAAFPLAPPAPLARKSWISRIFWWRS